MEKKYFISFIIGLFLASIIVLFSSCNVLKNKETIKETEKTVFSGIDTTKTNTASHGTTVNTDSFKEITVYKHDTIIKIDSFYFRIPVETTYYVEGQKQIIHDTTYISSDKKGISVDSSSLKNKDTFIKTKETTGFKFSWLIYILVPVIAGIFIYFKFIKK